MKQYSLRNAILATCATYQHLGRYRGPGYSERLIRLSLGFLHMHGRRRTRHPHPHRGHGRQETKGHMRFREHTNRCI